MSRYSFSAAFDSLSRPNPSLHWTRLRRAVTGRLDSLSIGFTIVLDSYRRASELNRWAALPNSPYGTQSSMFSNRVMVNKHFHS